MSSCMEDINIILIYQKNHPMWKDGIWLTWKCNFSVDIFWHMSFWYICRFVAPFPEMQRLKSYENWNKSMLGIQERDCSTQVPTHYTLPGIMVVRRSPNIVTGILKEDGGFFCFCNFNLTDRFTQANETLNRTCIMTVAGITAWQTRGVFTNYWFSKCLTQG